MKKLFWFLSFVVLLLVVWFVVNSFEITLNSPNPPIFSFAKVIKVIDGDTIEINTGQIIRYIGMDTPEIETSECYATEASEVNKNLVLGKTVKLVKDVSETDKYGRLLRFVYVGDIFVDDYLIKNGFAKIMTVPPDVEFKDQFLQSENYAKENKLGLWNKCYFNDSNH